MFNDITYGFDAQMIQNHLIKNFENSSSSSFWSDDEHNDYPYYAVDGVKTRIIWVTNYITNENFSMHVSVDDPLRHIVSTSSSAIEQESLLSNEKDALHTLDLSKLNLDDLLLLLYRLQQRTTKTPVTTSNSTISSSSSSSSSSSDCIDRQSSFQTLSPMSTLHSLSPTLSHAVQSSLSMLNNPPSHSHSINRRQSSFTLSNIADVPKQLMTTLTKPISSFHSQNTKHIHSPNDVVDRLLQSFHLRNTQKLIERKSLQYSPGYTYQESQQHKAKLISNLLSSTNNFYH